MAILAICALHFCLIHLGQFQLLLLWTILASFGLLFYLGPFWPVLGCIFVILPHFRPIQAVLLLYLPIFASFGLHFDRFRPFRPFMDCFFVILNYLGYFGLHF